ncbi:hypothetical protein BJV78DRAFT_15257 [Lactifluus subvellereus]|nr:hypothetical protein BJV78DRAFT_15257 [Lactifluus subvellereus]
MVTATVPRLACSDMYRNSNLPSAKKGTPMFRATSKAQLDASRQRSRNRRGLAALDGRRPVRVGWENCVEKGMVDPRPWYTSPWKFKTSGRSGKARTVLGRHFTARPVIFALGYPVSHPVGSRPWSAPQNRPKRTRQVLPSIPSKLLATSWGLAHPLVVGGFNR